MAMDFQQQIAILGKTSVTVRAWKGDTILHFLCSFNDEQ
jgi:hypothetical protein